MCCGVEAATAGAAGRAHSGIAESRVARTNAGCSRTADGLHRPAGKAQSDIDPECLAGCGRPADLSPQVPAEDLLRCLL